LQFEALVIGLDGLESLGDLLRLLLLLILAQLLVARFALTGVMIGETRIPLDATVDSIGQRVAVEVRAGLFLSAIHVHEVRAGHQHLRSLFFSRVPVNVRL